MILGNRISALRNEKKLSQEYNIYHDLDVLNNEICYGK